MHMADSLCCTTETNSIVKQLYSNKNLLKKKKKAKSPAVCGHQGRVTEEDLNGPET